MESIEFILAILAAMAALLIVIVIYKMGMKQKNVDLIKEQLRIKRLEGIKDGAEFAAGASGLGAAETVPAVPKNDKYFDPSC